MKNLARRAFTREVRRGIPRHEPLLEGIGQSHVHEGKTVRLTRQDESTDQIEFTVASATLDITREQMRRISGEQLLEHASRIAGQFAEQQAKHMFARLSEAVEQVGNSVSAADLGMKEAYLEMQRRLEVDFDPETLEPKNQVLVMHPSAAENFIAQATEWDQDPEFVTECERIRQQQIEAWRARENRRKLVD
ncbi:MAG TPA: hypothetical protein VFE05_18345 [Longimicrobiaceae bacterium]|nr:hypothetical protein [Longimicrobiaceae bacterium]